MGKYQVILKPTAEKHLSLHKKTGNKAVMNKIQILIAELEEHPYTGTGQPEQLKYELARFWSRRITQKDRLIYSVHENIVTVEVISAIGHYGEK
jgi:toxin YoeB